MSAEEKWWQTPDDNGSCGNPHLSGKKGLDRLMEEHPIISAPLTLIAIGVGSYIISSLQGYIIDYFRK